MSEQYWKEKCATLSRLLDQAEAKVKEQQGRLDRAKAEIEEAGKHALQQLRERREIESRLSSETKRAAAAESLIADTVKKYNEADRDACELRSRLSSAENAIALYKLAITSESPEASLMEENRQLSSRLDDERRAYVELEQDKTAVENERIALQVALNDAKLAYDKASRSIVSKALLAERDSLVLRLDNTLGSLEIAGKRIAELEGRLRDVGHAMEHAEEIGRMDHYAANTIKQALAVERQTLKSCTCPPSGGCTEPCDRDGK